MAYDFWKRAGALSAGEGVLLQDFWVLRFELYRESLRGEVHVAAVFDHAGGLAGEGLDIEWGG